MKNRPENHNENNYFDVNETEFTPDTFFNNIPKEGSYLVFIDDLRKEDKSLSEFISHVHEDAVGENLVARF